MCGIIGVLTAEPAAPMIIAALKRLEYRGYDSAGVATIDHGRVERRRAAGKIRNLEAELKRSPLTGRAGIGHTRWATHGAPTVANAHPHQAGRVTVVHNGIIENFRDLRAECAAGGSTFESETDSEVIATLINEALLGGATPVDAVRSAIGRMRGAYAIAVMFADESDLLIGARRGSPLVAGFGVHEAFLGSDAIAVSPFTKRIMYLDEGDIIVLSRDQVDVFDVTGARVDRAVENVVTENDAAEKGAYPHFMLKEIHEQPETIARTAARYVDPAQNIANLPRAANVDFAGIRRLHIVACGSAYYAGRVAKYWFERYAALPVNCEIASEFRYSAPAVEPGDAVLVISQSGETADTLAALRIATEHKLQTIGVINVPSSSMARECSLFLPTLAGAEIGVASTKAFTAQLTTLAAMAIAAGRARGRLSRDQETALVAALLETPRLIADALKSGATLKELAPHFSSVTSTVYLGRDVFYPVALEGALKLKEISYIHAEGFASGELKHGPIALIDEHVPVVMIAPFDPLFEKALSNLQEVAARGGRVLLISDAKGLEAAGDTPWLSMAMPTCHPLNAPIVHCAPLQLLAYHVAVARGADVDQPRNLAKSVTVE